ncbi:MAG: hypothetical protein M1834_001722 [Cirrosporium novae-zelandiae]|nr:MAG: hypothetical protein M1834_001722 [Cirrosporium novae-zelandiae]
MRLHVIWNISQLWLASGILILPCCEGFGFFIKQDPQPSLQQSSTVQIASHWDVLGPMQLGTREIIWGADPLEYFGGFNNLKYSSESVFPSSLSPNGTIKWSVTEVPVVQNHGSCQTVLKVYFPDVDWSSQQDIYGWAAFQYQSWARDHVMEFWVDEHHFFGGDLYGFHKVPVVLQLSPGHHRLDIRLVRDVRSMGGVGLPTIETKIEVMVATDALLAVKESILVPDVVEGKLASDLASLTVRSQNARWIRIEDIHSLNDNVDIRMLSKDDFSLAPSQSRPLAFRISLHSATNHNLSLEITYRIEGLDDRFFIIVTLGPLKKVSFRDPHKITFLHPGGVVSYAILRAPFPDLECSVSTRKLAVLLNLHGAGLDADSEQLIHTFDPVPDLCAWVLFPAGVTSWSGDDWHIWGFADVEAAIEAIPQWIRAVEWKGPGVDTKKWLVTGHSNGGQGVWYALTHYPDSIIAAAPASGYMSIEAYVPYTYWNEVEPLLSMVIWTSRSSYRHQLLLKNFASIPIMQQHGGADDNVPPYHSRRLHQLSLEAGWPTEYIELPAAGHWFEGVMTTPPLRAFYKKHLKYPALPNLPSSFSIIIPPSAMVSRGGIVVDQLESPDQQGQIKVEGSALKDIWVLRTTNVHRFHFSCLDGTWPVPSFLKLDKMSETLLPCATNGSLLWFIKSQSGSWIASGTNSWQSIEERYGRQLGPLDGLLRSQGRFEVVTYGDELEEFALQVANNLFQYFGADTSISKGLLPHEGPGNVISLAVGLNMPAALHPTYPIFIEAASGLVLRDRDGIQRTYEFEEGLGAVFLQPLQNERIQVMVWGYDESGLRHATRLLPTLTGGGQPDFIVVGKESSWRGLRGVLAAGFLDYGWNISKASFLS